MWIFVWYAKSTLIVLQSGADTLIKFDATDTITLHGVAASSLTSSQFHFM